MVFAIATYASAQTAPTIGTQPLPKTVAAGTNASFTISATGSPTPCSAARVVTASRREDR